MTISQQHPITPPPKLRQLWAQQAQRMDPRDPVAWQEHVATQAARWGSDQQLKLDAEQINQAWQKGADAELEACCEWLWAVNYPGVAHELRPARRPKPPSLKEQALTVLDDASDRLDAAHENIIRRALESLPS